MEYRHYTFKKNFVNPRRRYASEARKILQPLEQICQEEGGIPIEHLEERVLHDLYRKTEVFIIGKVIVLNSVYLSHPGRQFQSSMRTIIVYQHHQGLNLPTIIDKMKSYYQKEPALAMRDSDKKLAGEYPAMLEKKRP